jgi:hypothetical protein
MKTIYLRKVKSGNFRITTEKDATVVLKTQTQARKFYESTIKPVFGTYKVYGSRIIKATYSQSQTYFGSFQEFFNFTQK